MGQAVGGIGETHQLNEFICVRLLRLTPGVPVSEADIVTHRVPRQQGRLLEDHSPLGIGTTDPSSVDPDRPLGRLEEPGQDPQQCGLPTPRRTHEADDLRVRNLQLHSPQRLDPSRGCGLVDLTDILDRDHW